MGLRAPPLPAHTHPAPQSSPSARLTLLHFSHDPAAASSPYLQTFPACLGVLQKLKKTGNDSTGPRGLDSSDLKGHTGLCVAGQGEHLWGHQRAAGITKIHLGSPVWVFKAPLKTIFLLLHLYRLRAPAAVGKHREIPENHPKICAGGAVPAWGSLGRVSPSSCRASPGLSSEINYSLNNPQGEKLHRRLPLAGRLLTCATSYMGCFHCSISNLRPLTGMNSRHLFLNTYI